MNNLVRNGEGGAEKNWGSKIHKYSNDISYLESLSDLESDQMNREVQRKRAERRRSRSHQASQKRD